MQATTIKTILLISFMMIIIALPRLINLGGYAIVDEPDRWRWAEEFSLALEHGDMSATLVGDGYPGIVPVWAETLWIYAEMSRRSLHEGEWIGETGLTNLLHQWQRTEAIVWQRLPIVLLNIGLAVTIIGLVWRLFGPSVAMLAALLIALDPFYLSDSRVNRAEAILTGLMTLSILSLTLYAEKHQRRYLLLSAICGGLSTLTKIQALILLPAIGLILLWAQGFRRSIRQFLLWILLAAAIWLIAWPALWVRPLDTLTLVFSYTSRKVGDEGVNLFFMGQTYQDADPGWLFYPIVFMFRITPLALIGLTAYIWAWWAARRAITPHLRASIPMLIYIISYLIPMSIGSHKQDRYLLPIFLTLDILAAIGLFMLWEKGQDWLNKRVTSPKSITMLPYALFLALMVSQIWLIYPHHPYYYSYFNPLVGGGAVAAQTLRVGWGEGMDQVGEYLAAKLHGADLIVATRFTHNMPAFKGEAISLLADGRWTQADYIVLYIQHVQRYQEPSPQFFDYFLAREPEHTITIGGIDYARIYPRPFTIPADPFVSRIEGQMALLGYSLEGDESLRLVWENLGLTTPSPLRVRLVSPTAEGAWTTCRPTSAFVEQAHTPNRFVESLCPLDLINLPPDSYTVDIALADEPPLTFPQGWESVRLTDSGLLTHTRPTERLDLLVNHRAASEMHRLERIYGERMRLVGYQLEPPAPQPGDTMTVTLTWQLAQEIVEPLQLTVQLADSRLLPLGRVDESLPVQTWLKGELLDTRHTFPLEPTLPTPLAAQVEVKLVNPLAVELPATTADGDPLTATIARFTLPTTAPLPEFQPTTAPWKEGIQLAGYRLEETADQLVVDLFWQTTQPISRNYMVFVHWVDDTGEIVAQHDSLPREGAYPTAWWQRGETVMDSHVLTKPTELPPGEYRLRVGLYEADNFQRLARPDGSELFEVAFEVVKARY